MWWNVTDSSPVRTAGFDQYRVTTADALQVEGQQANRELTMAMGWRQASVFNVKASSGTCSVAMAIAGLVEGLQAMGHLALDAKA
jgi:hypothetical protein